MAKRLTESPLKAASVRLPGQSSEERLHKLLDDVYTEHLVIIVITAVMLMTSLLQLLFRVPTSTMVVITSLYFLGALAYAVPKMRRVLKEARALRLGRDGERAVAEYLDTLRSENVRVVNDIVGEGFNLDHVLIAPQGVFCIETKTFSKPADKNAQVVYDGEKVTVGGFEPDRNPITQAKAQASWLHSLLKDLTGRAYSVRPVVLFPGWYVHRTNKGKGREVWVLAPRALESFLEEEPPQLTSAEVAQISNALKRYSRSG